MVDDLHGDLAGRGARDRPAAMSNRYARRSRRGMQEHLGRLDFAPPIRVAQRG